MDKNKIFQGNHDGTPRGSSRRKQMFSDVRERLSCTDNTDVRNTMQLKTAQKFVDLTILSPPASKRLKPNYIAPSMPRLLTPVEEYDNDPEFEQWVKEKKIEQENTLKIQMEVAAAKQSSNNPKSKEQLLLEEINFLKQNVEHLVEENTKLVKQVDELKTELNKYKRLETNKKYNVKRRKKRKPKFNNLDSEEKSKKSFENRKENSQNKVINDIWKALKDKYGEAGAKIIVEKAYERQIEVEKRSLNVAETLHIMKKCRINVSSLRDLRAEIKAHETFDPFASEYSLKEQRDAIAAMVKTISKDVYVKGKADEEVKITVETIKNVRDFLTYRLQSISNGGHFKTYTHNGVEEIALVLTCDKGGPTTKLAVGMGNTKKSINSPFNLSLLGIYHGDDTQEILYKAFEELAAQMNDIKELQVEVDGVTKTLKVRWFLLGDCKFLNAAGGLLGCSAVCPCVFCEQQRESTFEEFDMQLKAETRTPKEDPSVSQKRLPLFPFIPFDHYIPPPLHLTMGTGAQLFEALLERAADMDLADLKGENIKELLSNKKAKKSWEDCEAKIELLKDEIDGFNAIIDLYNNDEIEEDYQDHACSSSKCYVIHLQRNVVSDINSRCPQCTKCYHSCCLKNGQCPECFGKHPTVKQSAAVIKKELKEYEKSLKKARKALEEEETKSDKMIGTYKLGPLAQNLEKVLEANGGTRKAFFQAYTGKDLTKMGRKIDKIEEALDPKLQADEQIKKIIEAIKRFFHIQGLMSPQILSPTQIADIENNINQFALYMKEKLPSFRVKLKGHIYFKHLIDFIKTHKFATFFDDEAIESLHAIFNMYTKRIANKKLEQKQKLLFKYNAEDNWEFDRLNCSRGNKKQN